MGVLQRGDNLGLALKTRPELRIGGKLVWQNLDRDLTFHVGVAGQIHHCHPASAQFLLDFVAAKFLERHGQLLGGAGG